VDPLHRDSGIRIASFSDRCELAGEENSRAASINEGARSQRKVERKQESDHEISIHLGLVPHSARAASMGDLPVHPICAVAHALVSFPNFVTRWQQRSGFMKTFCPKETNKHSDGALVAAAKRGDEAGFEELVLRHRQRVLAVAQRIMKNREDAEDVAQESFHKAFLHLDDFQEKSRFSTWLTRIAMNEAFALLRRRRGVYEIPPGSSEDEAKLNPDAFIDMSPTPEESCWRRERAELLIAAIHRLGPRVQSTILLRDIEERTVKETAQILGTSTAAVKARVFQGRRRLRRTLNPGFLQEMCTAVQPEAQHC
jgi:RNA polymerase sigma-70 factor, ECF subfamily